MHSHSVISFLSRNLELVHDILRKLGKGGMKLTLKHQCVCHCCLASNTFQRCATSALSFYRWTKIIWIVNNTNKKRLILRILDNSKLHILKTVFFSKCSFNPELSGDTVVWLTWLSKHLTLLYWQVDGIWLPVLSKRCKTPQNSFFFFQFVSEKLHLKYLHGL